MPQQHLKPHEEPRRLAAARRVVERADEGERFPDDAAVTAALEDPRLAGEPFPATDDDTWGGPWPTREWLIPDWLPVGRLGLVTGRGGLGKSRLALQLAGRIAASPPQAGEFLPPGTTSGDLRAVTRALPPLDRTHAGSVVYASWEDEREEVGRRLEKMATDTLIHVKDLAGRLRFVDLRGDGPLWAPETGPGRSSHIATRSQLTTAGHQLRATVEAMDARLVIIDSLAGAYASDENVRALVRAFCADWDAWASRTRCAVMLIAHPPKTAGGTGAVDRDYAGSTDWHNAARWRWTLDWERTRYTYTRPTGTTKKGPHSDHQITAPRLTCTKASYGPNRGGVWLMPSASKIGWRGVTERHAAEAEAARRRITVHREPADADDEDPDAIRR